MNEPLDLDYVRQHAEECPKHRYSIVADELIPEVAALRARLRELESERGELIALVKESWEIVAERFPNLKQRMDTILAGIADGTVALDALSSEARVRELESENARLRELATGAELDDVAQRARVAALEEALRRLIHELPLSGNVDNPLEEVDISRLRDAQASARALLAGVAPGDHPK